MVILKSKDNTTIRYIQKLIKSSKFRKEDKSFVIEGARISHDAYLSSLDIKYLIVSQSATQKYDYIINDIKNVCSEFICVSDDLFKSISDTKTPQGIMCVCKIKDNLFNLNGRNFIALENIQDPSNMGTIFRTGEALGIDGFILSPNCCDIYSPKVLRGSMGGIFRIPFIITADFYTYLEDLKANNVTLFASLPDKNAKIITEIDFSNYEKNVVIIGNEGNGLTQDTIDLCNHNITIPMSENTQSLNASIATSLIIWEMVRK